ncbi:hypothetical protein GL272_21060 [Aeromonas veronii]|uniref:hypothetical protein n=1 Tax=Aeromonas veronii TaxID=654 RepID=UPI001C5A7ED6|nr:hypothetical protein [Aeromonas veronii]MBW3779364.1 hypothetical protein [Aeromonas veronii]
MSQSIKQQTFELQANILHGLEGLRTLAALVESCGHHGGDPMQTPAEFCVGLSALVGATADSLRTHCLQLDALKEVIAELEQRPSVSDLWADKERFATAVLAHYGVSVQELKDLKAGLVVLSPAPAPLPDGAPLSCTKHGPAAT